MRAKETIKKPTILFYGSFELTEGTKATPIYELTKCVGSYQPFGAAPIYNVRNKNITLYLGRAINDNPNAPALRVYRTDAFLFVIHYNKQRGTKDTTPRKIEILVLEGARVLIPLYAKQLQIGGFDADLERLRENATPPARPGNTGAGDNPQLF